MKIRSTLFFIVAFFYISLATVFAQNTYYVSPTGGNIAPYSSWADAATEIQTAVDQASDGDLVLVDDGTYVLSTNVSITKGITVKSVNGYSASIVDGNNATRCFYINHADAVLDGFTVTNGYNPSALNSGHGGGILIYSAGTVQNCLVTNSQARDGGGIAINNGGLVVNSIITNNSADNNSSNGYGGGVRLLNGGTLRGSIIYGNSSEVYGGGVNIWEAGTVENCTIIDNTAPQGAGIRARNNSTIVNSIIYFNNGDNWQTSGSSYSFNYSNSTPALPGGTGNITDDPLFENTASNDFHLTSSSTLINAGLNQAWMTGAYDIDGNDRILESTVDIGAYEYLVEPSIEVTSPNGGETYTGGSTENITWISSEVTNVNIEFSADNGLTWNTVANSIPALDGTYNFTIPNNNSTNCLIRIKDSDDSNVFDVSDNVFSIVTIAGDPTISIGSAISYGGATITIPVEVDLAGSVEIEDLLQGKIHFDPAKLAFKYGDYGTGTLLNSFGWTGVCYSVFPGSVDIILSGQNEIDQNGVLFYLTFYIKDLNAGSTTITSAAGEWSINVLSKPFVVENGDITYSSAPGVSAERGDATLNFVVDYNDALSILYHIIGLWPLSGQAFINADVNYDLTVNIDDYLSLVFYIFLHDWDFIPPIITTGTSIQYSETSGSSGIFEIPINLANSNNAYSAEVSFNYDANIFEFQGYTSSVNNGNSVAKALKENEGAVTFILASSEKLTGNLNLGSVLLKQKDGTQFDESLISTNYKLNNGVETEGSTIKISGGAVTSAEDEILPKDYALYQNFPNPFNPSTNIKYEIPKSSYVKLIIYNILGSQVQTLVDENQSAGVYDIIFDASNIPSGIYFYKLDAGSAVITKKMVLIK